ncbi:MAG: UvrD-helicase domain-containing protein [Halanaerobiales bacterium]
MNNQKLPDQIERDKMVNELDKNFLVEAGAGSGKTTSLIKRMVALVRSGRVSAGEIAAITFTRKAAAELKERFQSRLEKEYRESEDREEKTYLETALDELHRCFIGTVHSFSARLLRERPVEAGIDPEFTEMEEIEQQLLMGEAWEEYLLDVKLNNPSLLKNLDDCGITVLDLQDGFQTLNRYPEVEIVSNQVEKPDLRPVLDQLLAFCKEAVEYIPSREPEAGYDKLQEKIISSLRLTRYMDMKVDSHIIKILSNFHYNGKTKSKVTLNRWLDKDMAREYRDQITDKLLDIYIRPAIREWLEYCHYHIVKFLEPAVGYYQELRRQRSLLNFQDLLMVTAKMLRENAEVRKYFQGKYRAVLVDEFQDTDPIQAEIVFYLTGSDHQEKDWTALKPVPGSLFVVGDPKQSIYRFNRADIDTYNLVKEVLVANGGEVLKLSSNFRSLNSIAAYLNPLMKEYLPEEANTFQAAYVPLQTVRPDNENTDFGIRVLKIPEQYSKKADIVEADADSIARIIRSAVDGGMKLSRSDDERENGLTERACYGDFLILLRYKDMMDVYARALEKYNIPVTMTGGSTLDSHEIAELYKLLLFLNDVDNKVLLTAVLKGLFFGISDQQLYDYRNNEGSFNIYTNKLDEQSEIKNQFYDAFNRLKKYHRWTRSLPPAVVLEKIVIDLGLIPYASTQELGKSRAGNIYYLLEQIRKAECSGAAIFSEMVKEFEALVTTTPEKELNLSLEENTVRLMNLHKAKGLEAPVVFLAHPCKQPSIAADHHIKRSGKKAEGYFTFSKRIGWFTEPLGQPLDWQKRQEEEQYYQDAEELRLLYVAATRARNLLVISSCKNDASLNKSKNPWYRLIEAAEEETIIDIPELDESENFIETNYKNDNYSEYADEIACNSKGIDERDERGEKDEINKSAETDERVNDLTLEELGEEEESISEITVEKFIKKREECSKWIQPLADPTYLDLSPTEFKDSAALFSIKRSEGGGKAWGTAVHKVLEYLVKDRVKIIDLQQKDSLSREKSQSEENFMAKNNLKIPISRILAEDEIPLDRIAEIDKLINKFKDSRLWKRILQSENVLTEVPFSLKIEVDDPLYQFINIENMHAKAVPIILSGVIDLVFREEDGWVIVDYKTDHVENQKEFDELKKIYSGQVKIYAAVWEKITGEEVKDQEVWFSER